MTKTYYVHLFRRWAKNRWVTQIGTSEERPSTYDSTIARYEVQASTKNEAPAVVMEWLGTDRPKTMKVREIG